MQAPRYKIKFINGDLNGRSFAVKDSGLVIGTSMKADIRSSEIGLDDEHITILPQIGAGILLHNMGKGGVWVRNESVPEGGAIFSSMPATMCAWEKLLRLWWRNIWTQKRARKNRI